MSDSTREEEDLVSLISREQRSFRGMLFFGLAAIVALVAMSIALGAYYYGVYTRLNETALELQRDAFNARLAADEQNNRMNAQDRRLNRIHGEIRRFAGAGEATVNEEGALRAADAYLFRGRRLSLGEESSIEAAAANATTPAVGALLRAVAGLNSWNNANNSSLPNQAATLPPELLAIRADFIAAQAADPAFASRANAGLAWLSFLEAQSNYSNYNPEHCAALEASARAAAPGGPQLLYWQAQCERKLGHTSAALSNYAELMSHTWRTAFSTRDEGEMLLAMNAFHGVGTTLIVLNDASDAAVTQVLPLAREACEPEGQALMDVAIACLNKAIAMRQRIGQTPNEVSGTRENLGFAYLRTNNFEAALENAQVVNDTGLFAWNELVRALAASQAGGDAEDAGETARRNIRFFDLGAFAPCEIRKLLNADQFARATDILASTHSRSAVDDAMQACSQ